MAVVPHTYYNRNIPHGGDTALMFAARGGALASARALVAGGANVNDADAWSVSAVSLAAHSGFTELVVAGMSACRTRRAKRSLPASAVRSRVTLRFEVL